MKVLISVEVSMKRRQLTKAKTTVQDNTVNLSFGFTFNRDTMKPILLCLVCGQSTSSNATVQSKLKRYPFMKHLSLQNKNACYFVRQREHAEKQAMFFRPNAKVSKRPFKLISTVQN